MKRVLLIALFAVSFLCQAGAQSEYYMTDTTVYEINSPDKRISFSLKVIFNESPLYKVTVDGRDVIGWSKLGLTQSADEELKNWEIVNFLHLH